MENEISAKRGKTKKSDMARHFFMLWLMTFEGNATFEYNNCYDAFVAILG